VSTSRALNIAATANGDWLLSGTGPAAANYLVRASRDLVNRATIGSVTVDSSGIFSYVAPASSGNFFRVNPM